jgi:ribosomal protein L11 methylase PrmA
VTTAGLAHARAVRATGLVDRLIASGRLLAETEVEARVCNDDDVELVLEHPRVPFISYPYEWSFRSLQAAALLHLDIQLEALDAGVMLTDASAYNVQFVGVRPVFIDHLSFRPYIDGELWAAHRQFCEQFLHPLLLESHFGVPFQAWYRGAMDGVPGNHLVPLMRFRHKLQWKLMTHVFLPALLQRRAGSVSTQRRIRRGTLSRAALGELLASLRRWIARLAPNGVETTTWRNYDQTVSAAESDAISQFVRDAVRDIRPRMIWDLGCNSARFAQVALGAGAQYAVGFDSDLGALDRAVMRAREGDLALLPLAVDLVNPSPDQGWCGGERAGVLNRGRADALLALSIVHHMAIGRNVPLEEIARLLTLVAPDGVVAFVPATDTRAAALFHGREKLFAAYTYQNFVCALQKRARILCERPIPGTDRVLLRFSAA